ncbi:MAG: hypothetical protein Kow0059_18860 [Candidatus Sumerlaeia bacterium]
MTSYPSAYRPIRRLTLVLAVLVGAVYFAVARYWGDGGHAAPPQADSLLFLQYARAWGDGRPYQFQPGDPPSTGSTSHLYPALLGLLYAAGARGDALSTAALLLNAVLFVLYVGLVWSAARRLAVSAAPLAALLTVTSGQTAYTFFSQSEMGLFMVVSLGALAAALSRRRAVSAGLLFAAPWCRPEGALLAAGFAAAGVLAMLQCGMSGGRRGGGGRRSGLLVAGCFGLAGAALVAAFNHRLTGNWGFHSTAGKGYFAMYPPGEVLRAWGRDLAALVRDVVLGLGQNGRPFYTVPVLGAALGLAGLIGRRRVSARLLPVEAAWWGAGLGAVVLVAVSGWAGLQFDRYLAWLLPVWLIYIASGVRVIGRRVWGAAAGRGIERALGVGLVCWQVVGAVWFAAAYSRNCMETMETVRFVQKAGRTVLPPGARVGMRAMSGFSYYLPDQRVMNVSGVTSPRFAHAAYNAAAFAGVLRKTPAADRPTHWLLLPADAAAMPFRPFMGRQIMAQTPVYGIAWTLAVYEASWEKLDAGREPLAPEALRAVRGLSPADVLDVADPADEARAAYRQTPRVSGSRTYPAMGEGEIGGVRLADGGRLVMGAETFRVRAIPGRRVVAVLRTARRAEAAVLVPGEGIVYQDVEFATPLALNLEVNGRPAGTASIDFPRRPDGSRAEWTETLITIPADLIMGEDIELTVGGDHFSFGWWFYQ